MSRIHALRIVCGLFLLAPPSYAEDSAHCAARDLKLKSCVVKISDLKVTLGPAKLTWLQGPWRGIAEIPDHQQISSWESVKIFKMGERHILESKFWKTSPAELTVESLDWVVAEIHRKDFKVLLSRHIGKRKPAPEVKGEFIADEALDPGLEWKDHKIHWSVGKEQGSFE